MLAVGENGMLGNMVGDQRTETKGNGGTDSSC